MPPTSVDMSPSLWISLEGRGTDTPFAPGDVIIGYVHRAGHLVTPDARVHIQLHGRSKSKMIVHKGPNSVSEYRGRFNLIDDDVTASQLFKGPIHIPPGGDAMIWPFVITIPTHVSVKAVCALPKDLDTFIPTVPAQVRHHHLPPTMGAWELGYNRSVQGFVEYFLKADILSTVGGRKEASSALLPITIAHFLREPPIGDFKLTQRLYPCDVQTQLLLPGRQNDKLSVKEMFKKAMGTPSVPTLSLQLHIEVPTVLQMGNPTPVPFVLQLVPNWDKSTEKIQKEPQKAKLALIELKIETTTCVNCEGTFSNKSDDTRLEIDLGMQDKVKSQGHDIDLGQQGSWPAVDIGALLDLRLSPDSVPAVVKANRELNCSYATYNVQQTHALMWKVHIDVAGEPVNVVGKEMITILPESIGPVDHLPGPQPLAASETWMQPPPEGEPEVEAPAPPSFAQVQEEDRIAAKP